MATLIKSDGKYYWTDGSRHLSAQLLSMLKEENPGLTDWEIFNQHAFKADMISA